MSLTYRKYEKQLRDADPKLTEIRLWNGDCSRHQFRSLLSTLGNNETAKTLEVRMAFQDADREALSSLLRRNRSIERLEVRGCNLGIAGARLIAESLRTNTTLRVLNLAENNICDDGARCMAEALVSNSALRDLDIGTNNVGPAGGTALFEALERNPGSSLERLVLDWNEIGQGGAAGGVAEAIGRAIRREGVVLAEIGLSMCRIGAGGIGIVADSLRTNSSIRRIDLSGNELSVDKRREVDEAVRHLAEALRLHSAVRFIDLRQNNLGDEGMRAMARLIRHRGDIGMNLRHNAMSDGVAREIADAIYANPSCTQPVLRYLATVKKRLGEKTTGGEERLFGYLTHIGIHRSYQSRWDGPGRVRAWWRPLLISVYSAGTQQILRKFHKEEVNLVPFLVWRVGDRLGLGGFFELVRSKPDLFCPALE